jgi:hypothetical protein
MQERREGDLIAAARTLQSCSALFKLVIRGALLEGAAREQQFRPFRCIFKRSRMCNLLIFWHSLRWKWPHERFIGIKSIIRSLKIWTKLHTWLGSLQQELVRAVRLQSGHYNDNNNMKLEASQCKRGELSWEEKRREERETPFRYLLERSRLCFVIALSMNAAFAFVRCGSRSGHGWTELLLQNNTKNRNSHMGIGSWQ